MSKIPSDDGICGALDGLRRTYSENPGLLDVGIIDVLSMLISRLRHRRAK